jgi:hypothetical protein
MKQFKQKTLCYGLLAVLLMTSVSACGSLAMEGMSPMQGGSTLDRREMVQPAIVKEFVAADGSEMVHPPTTGEFVTVAGCAGAGQGPATHTECRPVQWNPSTGQVAASIAIGVAWYYSTVIDPWVESWTLGDGLGSAILGEW